jgi:D-cysteine desulfhydrase family pyridoxal phosphate-dependent enzyme
MLKNCYTIVHQQHHLHGGRHIKASRTIMTNKLYERIHYDPPKWIADSIASVHIPAVKVTLGRFPTPIHEIKLPDMDNPSLRVWIKRDDLTSFDLSGNKVRKLEFLLADCIEKGHDSVITIGGIQSNHAKATAVAARQLGLDSHLILRTPLSSQDIDFTGNLLFDRMVNAKIYTVTSGTYARFGSEALTRQLQANLTMDGRNPYVIPVGGSNEIGLFGYLEFVEELMNHDTEFDHIVFACGSGGTASGISIGIKLSGLKTKVHAIGVCDSPEYFYDHVKQACENIGIPCNNPQDYLTVHRGNGIGYAKSTDDEIQYIHKISSLTGIILDPVYSGKAVYHFVHHVLKESKEIFKPDDKILFVHTGGVLGLYEKVNQLKTVCTSSISRLDISDLN